MRSVVVGEGPHTGVRVSELRAHGEVTLLPDDDRAAEAVASSGADVVVIDNPGPRFSSIAAAAIRHGKHILAAFPSALRAADLRMLSSLAEEAGVRISVGGRFRMLPSVRPVSIRRPRIISVYATVAHTAEFRERLVDSLDVCLYLADAGDVQGVDSESARTSAGDFLAAGAAIRFRNGTLAFVHLGRGTGETIVSVGADHRSERVVLTPDMIDLESPVAARYHVRAFIDEVAGLGEPVASVRHAIHSLQLADHVMKPLKRRSVVAV